METPSETLTAATLVTPTDPPPRAGRSYTRLHEAGIQAGLSIEAAELNFTESRGRSVYGTIYINTTDYCKVHTIYNRPILEAETVSGDHLSLSLCGPNYFLPPHEPTTVYVHLRQVGMELPLFQASVPLHSNLRKPLSSVGQEATLTIHMTPISACTLTKISVELLHPHDPSYCDECLISGSVVAVLNLRIPPLGQEVERRLCLFKRREDDPMRAVKIDDRKAMISLDRGVFLAPLWFEKSYILEMQQLDLEADYPEDGISPDGRFYNGDGSYVSVEVDLKLVGKASADQCCHAEDTLHYQFKSSNVHNTPFRACLKPTDPEIEVAVTLRPFLGVMTCMDGEPYEQDILVGLDGVRALKYSK